MTGISSTSALPFLHDISSVFLTAGLFGKRKPSGSGDSKPPPFDTPVLTKPSDSFNPSSNNSSSPFSPDTSNHSSLQCLPLNFLQSLTSCDLSNPSSLSSLNFQPNYTQTQILKNLQNTVKNSPKYTPLLAFFNEQNNCCFLFSQNNGDNKLSIYQVDNKTAKPINNYNIEQKGEGTYEIKFRDHQGNLHIISRTGSGISVNNKILNGVTLNEMPLLFTAFINGRSTVTNEMNNRLQYDAMTDTFLNESTEEQKRVVNLMISWLSERNKISEEARPASAVDLDPKNDRDGEYTHGNNVIYTAPGLLNAATIPHEFKHFLFEYKRTVLKLQDPEAYRQGLIEGLVNFIGLKEKMYDPIKRESMERKQFPPEILHEIKHMVTEVLSTSIITNDKTRLNISRSNIKNVVRDSFENLNQTKQAQFISHFGSKESAIKSISNLAETESERLINLFNYSHLFGAKLYKDSNSKLREILLNEKITEKEKTVIMKSIKHDVEVYDSGRLSGDDKFHTQYYLAIEEDRVRMYANAILADVVLNKKITLDELNDMINNSSDHNVKILFTRFKGQVKGEYFKLRDLFKYIWKTRKLKDMSFSEQTEYLNKVLKDITGGKELVKYLAETKLNHKFLQVRIALMEYYNTRNPSLLPKIGTYMVEAHEYIRHTFQNNQSNMESLLKLRIEVDTAFRS